MDKFLMKNLAVAILVLAGLAGSVGAEGQATEETIRPEMVEKLAETLVPILKSKGISNCEGHLGAYFRAFNGITCYTGGAFNGRLLINTKVLWTIADSDLQSTPFGLRPGCSLFYVLVYKPAVTYETVTSPRYRNPDTACLRDSLATSEARLSWAEMQQGFRGAFAKIGLANAHKKVSELKDPFVLIH